MSPKPVSGVVLMGGKSSRMGRDKATLKVAGETLLARQLRLLGEAGCEERMVSVAARPGDERVISESVISDQFFRANPPQLIWDRFPEAGPLAGLERALALAQNDIVLVLAVDLPAMSADFLRSLLEEVTSECGVVPVIGGRFEPLVAVYPRPAHAEAELRLGRGELALQAFVRTAIAAGWLRPRIVNSAEERLFTNWNRPEDLAAG